jgi:putative flippase GtrA
MTARVRNVLPEISRFASIGVVATAIYLVVSTALISWSDLPPEISSVVAYLCGMAVSFFGQGLYTFRVSASGARFARFCVLSIMGLALSFAAVRLAALAGASPLWGAAATSILVPILSYVVMKAWVFREDG